MKIDSRYTRMRELETELKVYYREVGNSIFFFFFLNCSNCSNFHTFLIIVLVLEIAKDC